MREMTGGNYKNIISTSIYVIIINFKDNRIAMLFELNMSENVIAVGFQDT